MKMIIAPFARSNIEPNYEETWALSTAFPSNDGFKYNYSEHVPCNPATGKERRRNEFWQEGALAADGITVVVTRTWCYMGRVQLVGITDSDAAILEPVA